MSLGAHAQAEGVVDRLALDIFGIDGLKGCELILYPLHEAKDLIEKLAQKLQHVRFASAGWPMQ